MDKIKVQGARVHNLKNVDLEIPKNKLVVFTGVSGSGKSSLAYDTIYAEGQRRYVESLSTYARQFLGVMEKPEVDLIEGLSPAISIDQKTTSRNPRSTVGTVTEIYDYMRLLFARVGHPHCPVCGREISSQSVDQIVEALVNEIKGELKINKKARFMVLSPVVRDKKGEFQSLFANLKSKGFRKIRVDGQIRGLDEDFVLIKTNKHSIEAVIDTVSLTHTDIKEEVFEQSLRSRLSDSIEQALNLADGLVILSFIKDASLEMPEFPKEFDDHLFSESFACPVDNIQIPEIEPRTFSFNSPHGACSDCGGIGSVMKVDPEKLFATELTISEGGILPYKNMYEHDTWYSRLIRAVAEENGFGIKTRIKKLEQKHIDILLEGTGDREYKVAGKNRFGKETYIYETFTGIVAELERRYTNTESNWVRSEIEKYMRTTTCATCDGRRLSTEALSVTVDGKNIHDATVTSITDARDWVDKLNAEKSPLSSKERQIGKLILNEIGSRLKFLESVGLEYLTLSRPAATLSSGEAQRIRLASQIGSGLTGVLYVLDEPTIGLHMRDNQKLIDTLKNLRDLGNSVVVVEHDDEMMKQSDFIVDFGPGAGKNGGEVVATGTPTELIKNKKSITGPYLNGKSVGKFKASQELPLNGNGERVEIKGCTLHNLKNVDLSIPLGKLVVISGVSGSGKSSLLVETVFPALQQQLNSLYRGEPGPHKSIEGIDKIDKALLINQSPIGRTPRSNPATYTKLFDLVRDAFAETRDAKLAGFKKGRFSFNTKGGRCEACEGQGQKKIEMQFMSDLWIKCEVCDGKRYNTQTLDIHYRGKNIADVLDMTVDDALEFFHAHPGIMRKLETLKDVGLGYMELGQPATTLSGGEAQRVKLSSELALKSTGKTLYILDEPTTGLHFRDIEKLLKVLRTLVERGNTVVVIEHNVDILKNADWIIDLGPEGGIGGGEIVAQGTIDDIKNSKRSHTAEFL